MTTPVSLALAALVLALLLADWAWFDMAGLVFLGRRLADLIEYLAFWR
jgi:hypothetical protein